MIIYILQTHRDFGTELDEVQTFLDKYEAVSHLKMSVLATAEECGSGEQDIEEWKESFEAEQDSLLEKDEFTYTWKCNDQQDVEHCIELYSQFTGE